MINNINGKIYIGCHKTDNIDDGYMGSGKILKQAIKKYGQENFTKEIIKIFKTEEEMFNMETILVNEDFIKDPNTYNIKEGGDGGWSYINKNISFENRGFNYINKNQLNNSTNQNIKGSQIHHHKLLTDSKYKEDYLIALNNGIHNYIIANGGGGAFTGRKHTEITKKRMSEIAKQRLQDPTKHPQFGTMWITNEIESKKIKNTAAVPKGWRKGRKMK